MKREGRLIEDNEATSNFSQPNFRNVLPLPVLLRGLSSLLTQLYEPAAFFKRSFRSLESWRPRSTQKAPELPMSYNLRILMSSIWKQGMRSSYRLEYWRFLGLMLRSWLREPAKLWLGFMVLLSAHHFINYSQVVAKELERHVRSLEDTGHGTGTDRGASVLGMPVTDVASA